MVIFPDNGQVGIGLTWPLLDSPTEIVVEPVIHGDLTIEKLGLNIKTGL